MDPLNPTSKDPSPSSSRIRSIVLPGPTVNATAAGATLSTSWINNLGYPIFVLRGTIFAGESMGGRSDTALWFVNRTAGDVFDVTNWDHYAEPTSIDSNRMRFSVSPYWFLVMPGDEIVISATITGPYAPETTIPTVASQGLLYYLQ